MTPQELKNSILQLAIQGKLVEQRPEEGTAQELYAQIQAEKQRLIKEGKLKKEKPLPEITEDEKPFEIPEGWMWVRVGDVLSKITDGTHHSPPNSETGEYKYITAKNIKDFGIDLKNITYVSKAVHDEIYSRCNPNKGDVLLIKDGATTGVVTVNNIEEPFSMLSSVALLKLTHGIFAWYLVYVLRSDLFYKNIRSQMKGTGITRITLKQIVPLVIPLPPHAEQKRIVAKIEELLPLVDRYEQAWTKLEDFNRSFPEDMKKSILQQAIQGKLVEQRPEEGTAQELYAQIQAEKQRLIKEGKIKKEKPLPEIAEDEKPFEIPEGWMWVKLGMIVSVLGGKRIPAGRKLTTENTGYRYIRVSDMKDGTVSTEDILYVPSDIYPSISRYIIKKEDIYITVAGTIGRIGKIPEELDGANLTENADRLAFSGLNQDWLIKCLQSSVIQSQIADATTKVGQPKLAIKRIQELLVPLPPLAEQKRIVARLQELLPMCERLK